MAIRGPFSEFLCPAHEARRFHILASFQRAGGLSQDIRHLIDGQFGVDHLRSQRFMMESHLAHEGVDAGISHPLTVGMAMPMRCCTIHFSRDHSNAPHGPGMGLLIGVNRIDPASL